MKLVKWLRDRKNRKLSVSELMDKADSTVWIQKHGKQKFICLYAVVDMADGFRTVKDGFKTKADAKAFCGNNYNLFINPYFVKK